MLQSVRQFSSNQIPNLNGVLFWRRDLARWKHLNLSFFLIKSKLHSHCLQLWWKFQHLIHGNIAFEQQPNISYLRPWFLRRVLDHLNHDRSVKGTLVICQKGPLFGTCFELNIGRLHSVKIKLYSSYYVHSVGSFEGFENTLGIKTMRLHRPH